MKDFRQLKVWARAHQLTPAIYHVTGAFPCEETYGLASQMRRAASSIPSNIAEGFGRDGDADSPASALWRAVRPANSNINSFWVGI